MTGASGCIAFSLHFSIKNAQASATARQLALKRGGKAASEPQRPVQQRDSLTASKCFALQCTHIPSPILSRGINEFRKALCNGKRLKTPSTYISISTHSSVPQPRIRTGRCRDSERRHRPRFCTHTQRVKHATRFHIPSSSFFSQRNTNSG